MIKEGRQGRKRSEKRKEDTLDGVYKLELG